MIHLKQKNKRLSVTINSDDLYFPEFLHFAAFLLMVRKFSKR